MQQRDEELLNSAAKLLKKAKKRKEKKKPRTYKLCDSTVSELEKIATEHEMNYDQLFKYLIKLTNP